MGLCSSELSSSEQEYRKNAKVNSKKFDQALRDDKKKDLAQTKILFLGAGESGKSTLLKQMKLLYGKGFPKDLLDSYVGFIRNNCILSLHELIQASATPSIGKPPAPELKEVVEDIMAIDGSSMHIPPELAPGIRDLWDDDNIQYTYSQRSKFQLNDSCAYFLDKIEEICKPSYQPSNLDVLHGRVRTTGIVEEAFIVDDHEMQVIDVGGQRNERKKWIHCFDSVTAVLFVAALSAYDQVLYEDATVNRMTEALNLFGETINTRWFRTTPIILFLNKYDLFVEKVAHSDITKKWKEHGHEFKDDARDPTAVTEFIQRKFELKDQKEDPDRNIYTHLTDATDTNNMRKIFDDVRAIIIQSSITEAGL